MYVPVDQVITLWEERNQLREEAVRLRHALAEERTGCAQEVEDLAQAFAGETDQAEFIINALRVAADMIRERGQEGADAAVAEPMAGDVPMAEPIDEPPPGPPEA
jgi:hypothetical protein